jgi:hypothetical protein
MSQFANSKIFLVNEDDDGYGFMCSESNSQPKRVYTMSWHESTPSVRLSYMSHNYLYDKALYSLIKVQVTLHNIVCTTHI